MRRSLLLAVLLVLAAPCIARAQAPGPYYARGNFYCASNLSGTSVTDSCYGYGPEVMLVDDGQHDDDADGDGVYGGWVTVNQPAGRMEFKVANADWSFNVPSNPGYPLWNGCVFTSGPGDVVHFRLDLSAPSYGWLPAFSVSNDHGYPPGTQLELMGSAPELGSWGSGLLADHVGSMWSVVVNIETPGTYEFKFRTLGTWNVVNFGADYNNMQGRNGSFTTPAPNTTMVIQFDEHTGRVRAIDDTNVPVRTTSWGRLKAIYR